MQHRKTLQPVEVCSPDAYSRNKQEKNVHMAADSLSYKSEKAISAICGIYNEEASDML